MSPSGGPCLSDTTTVHDPRCRQVLDGCMDSASTPPHRALKGLWAGVGSRGTGLLADRRQSASDTPVQRRTTGFARPVSGELRIATDRSLEIRHRKPSTMMMFAVTFARVSTRMWLSSNGTARPRAILALNRATTSTLPSGDHCHKTRNLLILHDDGVLSTDEDIRVSG